MKREKARSVPSSPSSPERALRLQAKAELRRRMRSVRRVLPAAARTARALALADHLVALTAYTRAQTIAGYVAVRGEADPGPVLAAAQAAGKTVALPRVDEDAGIVFHRWQPGQALVESADGIPEPTSEAERLADDAIDLVIVPALAVDARGHRIGYGRGFYDRLLPRLVRAHKVAFVYDFQLLAELPDTEGDERVDEIVTDHRVLSLPLPPHGEGAR